jgi:RNA polymerase sigma-70 factor (ECF subfamily)
MEKYDDNFYIGKVLDGQTNYFSYLVERHKDVVFSIALKVLKNRNDAEEMAQETFIKAYNSLGSFRGNAQFSTWLYRIAYNNCISEIRKRKITFASTDEVVVAEETEEMNFDGMKEENRARAVKEAMEKLPEEEYTILLLYYFEEKTVDEICEITRLSESNVKIKLFRARKKMNSILNEMMKDELYTIL